MISGVVGADVEVPAGVVAATTTVETVEWGADTPAAPMVATAAVAAGTTLNVATVTTTAAAVVVAAVPAALPDPWDLVTTALA